MVVSVVFFSRMLMLGTIAIRSCATSKLALLVASVSLALVGCGGGGGGVGDVQLAREKAFQVFLEDLQLGVEAFRDLVEDTEKRALVNKFAVATEEVTGSTAFELINILGSRCKLDDTSLNCSTGEGPLSFGEGPTKAGYSLTLTLAGSSQYAYSITKSTEAYEGTLGFASGQVSLVGQAPSFYKVGASKFARSSEISFSAVVNPSGALSETFTLSQGVPISLTVNGSQSSLATSREGVSVPDFTATLTNLLISLTPGPNEELDVREGGASLAASGAITLTAGGDRLSGQVSVTGQGKVGSASLTGNLSMASGETGTLALTLGLDDTNLANAGGVRSSANFQKGSLDASLSLSEGGGPAFAGISASYREAQSAAEFNKASLSVTVRLSKAEDQRTVRLSVTGLPVDMSSPEASGEILDIPKDQLLAIETSGGFKVSIPLRDARSGVYPIFNSENQEVGKIKDGLIYIGNSVSSLQF